MQATSDAEITADIESAATAFEPVTINDSKKIAVDAVIAMNRLSAQVQASISGSPQVLARGGELLVSAASTAAVTSHVVAPAIAIGAGFGSATSVAVALSLSRNDNHNDVQAFIDNVAEVTARPAR